MDQEIMKMAISKAIENGWKEGKEVFGSSVKSGGWDWICEPEVMFDHDFARALWGDDETSISTGGEPSPWDDDMSSLPAWQYHLQQMVISDDPIKYLGEHLE